MYEKPQIMKTKQVASINKADIVLSNLSHSILITSIPLLLYIWFQVFDKTIDFLFLENQRRRKIFEKYL